MGGFTVLDDSDRGVWRHFEITQPPAFVFIAANGATRIARDVGSVVGLDAQFDASNSNDFPVPFLPPIVTTGSLSSSSTPAQAMPL